MNIKYLLIFILIPTCLKLFAQATPSPPRLDIDAIEISYFINSDNYNSWNKDEFIIHSTENIDDIIGEPGENFQLNKGDRSSAGVVRFDLCITPINRKSALPEYTRGLKIGAAYYFKIANSSLYFLHAQGIADTNFYTGYNYQLTTDQVSLDFSWLFKTNPKNGISLFAGAEAGVGHSIHSTIEANYLKTFTVSTFDTSCNCSVNESGTLQEATIISSSKSPFYLNLNVPAGIEFRVINRWRVSVKGNTGVSWQIFINSPDAIRFGYAVGAGLKYFW